MKILIYMTGGFDTHGPSNHLYKALIEDCLKSGIEVKLVESVSSNTLPQIPESFNHYENFSYQTVKLNVVPKNKFIKRYLNLVKYAFRSRKVLKENKDYDVVFVQSCASAPFQVGFAKKITKKPVIYNIQDMFPGSSIATGVMKRKWMQKIFFMFQKIAYKKADHITVISEDMKVKLLEQGVSEEKISVIVNWFDDQAVKEISWADNKFVKKYDIKNDKFFVQYAGGMGYVFDYEKIIYAASKLKDNQNIVFQMIGDGSLKNKFVEEAKSLNLTNIEFYPMQPQNIVADVYSSCSICLIPLKKGVIGNSVPSKAGLLMACRRVVLNSVDENSDYFNIFNDNLIGISVSNDNPDELVNAIVKLYENPKLIFELANNAKEYGYKYYSRSVNTAKYISLFYKICEYGE